MIKPTLAALAVLTLAGCASMEPGIRFGAHRVERSVFGAAIHGEVRTMVELVPAPADGGSIWVGQEQGVTRWTPKGVRCADVGFDQRLSRPAPVQVQQDGRFRTIDRGGGWVDVKLLDIAGRTMWTFPPEGDSAADAMAAGPLGPDGELMFAVGMNGAGGVRLLDLDGLQVRRFDAVNVFSIEIADVDADGRPEILHTDDRRNVMQLRAADGSPLADYPCDYGDFSLVRWPEPDSPLRVLGVDDDGDVITVEPLSGAVLARFPMGGYGFASVHGVVVRPAPGATPWLAITRTIRATMSRSALYLYDGDGRLVYHQVFPVPYIAAMAVPAGADGTQHLLVGAGPAVMRYVILPDEPRSEGSRTADPPRSNCAARTSSVAAWANTTSLPAVTAVVARAELGRSALP